MPRLVVDPRLAAALDFLAHLLQDLRRRDGVDLAMNGRPEVAEAGVDRGLKEVEEAHLGRVVADLRFCRRIRASLEVHRTTDANADADVQEVPTFILREAGARPRLERPRLEKAPAKSRLWPRSETAATPS